MLLALSLLSGCAVSAPAAHSTAAAPAKQVYVTGSSIPVPVDPDTGLPQTALPTQTVTRQQMDRTGYDTVGPALRELVPQLH